MSNDHSKYPNQEVIDDASAFNKRVWTSQHMVDAKKYINDALGELNDGEGWGLMPLQAARNRLAAAIDIIQQMEDWKK